MRNHYDSWHDSDALDRVFRKTDPVKALQDHFEAEKHQVPIPLLEAWCGSWNLEVDVDAGLWGPILKISGSCRGFLIPGGMHLRMHIQAIVNGRIWDATMLHSLDQVTNSFRFVMLDNYGAYSLGHDTKGDLNARKLCYVGMFSNPMYKVNHEIEWEFEMKSPDMLEFRMLAPDPENSGRMIVSLIAEMRRQQVQKAQFN